MVDIKNAALNVNKNRPQDVGMALVIILCSRYENNPDQDCPGKEESHLQLINEYLGKANKSDKGFIPITFHWFNFED